MGISIKNIKVLNDFRDGVNKYKGRNLADEFAKVLIEEAVSIAEKKYGSVAEVRYENISSGVYTLVAKGDQIAYIEFGTGTAGEGKYDDTKLPKDIILKFKSRGQEQETQGWVYNYYKKKSENKDNPNIKNWVGHEPKAYMFETAQELARRFGEIIENYIEKEYGGKK